MIYSHQIIMVSCAAIIAGLALIQGMKQPVALSVFVAAIIGAGLFYFMVEEVDPIADAQEAEAELNWNHPDDRPESEEPKPRRKAEAKSRERKKKPVRRHPELTYEEEPAT